jgi:hypothetical protein
VEAAGAQGDCGREPWAERALGDTGGQARPGSRTALAAELVQLVLGHVGADLGQLDHLVDPRVGVYPVKRAPTPVAAGRHDRCHPVRRQPFSLVPLVARLSASHASRGLLRLARSARWVGRRRLRRVLGVLPKAGQQLGDLRLQGGDFPLQLGDARVARVQLRHRERRSHPSPPVDPPRPSDRSHGASWA